MMFETPKEALSLATAALGLLSAWLGYRALLQKQKGKTPTSFPLRTLSIRNPNVRIRPWKMARIRWLFIAPVALNALTAIVLFHDLFFALANLVAAALITLFVLLLRTDPPSRTLKRAEYLLDASPVRALEFSMTALTTIGASIGHYDSAQGLIEARMPMTWRTFGQIVTVTAHALDEHTTRLRIESDAVQPSVLVDWGENARTIRRYQEQLLGAGVQEKSERSG